MKKIISLVIIMFCCFIVMPQDVIVKKDGTAIISKVIEVNPSNIKYKKYSNLSGPMYTILLSEIMAVNYENGEKETFEPVEIAYSQDQNSQSVLGGIAKPSDNNQSILNQYNNYSARFVMYEPPKESRANWWAGILAVDTSSVMSSEYLEASLCQEESCLLNGTWMHPWPFNGHFYIELKNKTNKTIYIDLGNTFRVDGSGGYKVYYDAKQITVGQSSGSGVGLNVGSVSNALGIGGAVGTIANGISVGGGKSNNTLTTYAKQRIVAIPSHATMVVEKCDWDHVKGTALWKMENCVYKSYCEGFNYSSLKHEIRQNQIIEFDYSNSPCKYMYTITYSLSQNFNKWEALTINVYARSIYGGVKIYHRDFNKIKERCLGYTPTTIIIGGTCYE